ncbi:MAG TPA: hypothetical protein VIV11_38630 [Kofleriaceae bacterium]
MAVLVGVAMLSGCTTYGGSKTTAKVGGVMTVAGFATWLPLARENASYDEAGLAILGTMFVLIPGALLGVGGLIGMAEYKLEPVTDAPVARAHEQERQARAQALDLAWALTKAAAAAARSGDCNSVIAQSPGVREIDADFHSTVFMRDVAIKRCLDEASAPSVGP